MSMDETKRGFDSGMPSGVSGSLMAGIPTLNSSNFRSWNDLVRMTLKLRKVHRALEDTEVPEEIDLMASLIMKGSMDEIHLGIVRGAQTAREIMDRLEMAYADRSAANRYRIIHQFYRMTKSPEDSMKVHVGKMDDLRNQMRDLGESQSEAVYQVALIGSLPKEYQTILESWELTHESMRTTQNLVARLFKKERDLAEQGGVNKEQVFVGQASNAIKKDLSIKERKKRSTCGNCGLRGHWWRECPSPRTRGENDIKTKVEAGYNMRTDVMFNMNALDEELKDSWIIDSGASRHMTNNKRWFAELEEYSKPGSVLMGNGEELKIIGKGTVALEVMVGKKIATRKLAGVLLIPDLKTNLISVGTAEESGVTFQFGNGLCRLKLDGLTIAEAIRSNDRLYHLCIPRKTNSKALIASTTRSFNDYHRILGHASPARVRGLLEQVGIKISGNDKIDCPDCPLGKAQRASHPSTNERSSDIGILHVDLSGKVGVASIEGYHYYMLCKDEATEFVMAYMLKAKSDVPAALARMLIEFEIISGHRVWKIHTDNGSEFVNQVTATLWLKERVIHKLSAPYCPQQNGMIEREMRTITSSGSVMLNASGLPKTIWSHAIGFAVYVKNRLPTAFSNRTPFQRLIGRLPTIDHLVEFGCQVHSIINGDYLTKWDPKTEPGYVVGFTARRNTYKVYLPARDRVIESCDVIFKRHKEILSSSREPHPQEDSRCKVELQLVDSGAPKNDSIGFESTRNEHFVTTDDRTPRASTPIPAQRQNSGRTLCTGRRLDDFFETMRGERDQAYDTEDPPDLSPKSSMSEHSTSVCDACSPPRLEESRHVTWRDQEDPVNLDESRQSAALTEDGNREELLLTRDCLEPSNYNQAMEGPNSSRWKIAIEEELAAHNENQTWSVVDRPESGVALTSRWVFVIKRASNGTIERYKARLVVRGFQQRPVLDYGETFAPVARSDSVRTLLALAGKDGLEVCQFDVSTAFLNGEIDRQIYMEAPAGVHIRENQCLLLNKALYGLKQAPKCWNTKFDEVIKDLGFKQTLTDSCVYKQIGGRIILLVYVDDGLVIGPDRKQCEDLITNLNRIFKVRQMSGSCFIGIQILRNEDTLAICQHRYIKDVIKRFDMNSAIGVSSPIVAVQDLRSTEGRTAHVPYRELLGCLQYIAGSTRPDVLFAVNFLARFCEEPKEKHWSALKRVLRYLIRTQDLMIVYKKGASGIQCFSDADWANDTIDRKSTSGTLITLAGGPIVFGSRKQPTIAQSSTEAEYIAANEAVKELSWLTQFLDELGYPKMQTTLHIDNKPTIDQIKTTDTKRRSKHVEVRYHFIREKLTAGMFKVEHVATEHQPADMLTKEINGPRISHLVELINMSRGPIKRKSETCTMLNLTVALLCLLVFTNGTNAYSFEETDEILLIETQTRIELGVELVDLSLGHVSPCEILTQRHWDAAHNTSGISFEGLMKLCEKAYEEEVLPAYEELGRCLQHEPRGTRWKREPVTLAVLGTISLVTAVTTAAGGIYVWLTGKEEREALRRRNEEISSDVKILKEQLRVAQEVRAETIRGINNTLELVENNRRAIINMAQYVPNLTWESSNLVWLLKNEKLNVNKLTRACRKKKVDTTALNNLLAFRQLSLVEESDTHLEETKYLGKDLIFLQFNFRLISKDTKVYEIASFPHYKEISEQTIFVEYKGPKYAIHNSSSECTKAIDDPGNQPGVYAECRENNYTDPKLKHWEPASGIDQSLHEPRAFRSGQVVHISCFGHSILIDNKTRPCPHHPFKLSIDTPFTLPNASHVVNNLRLSDKGRHMPMTKLRMHNTSDEAYDRGNRFLYQIAMKNDISLKQQGGFILPEALSTLSPVNWLMLAGSLIAIGTFIFKVLKCLGVQGRSTQTAEHDSHAEQVNVTINQTPPTEPEHKSPPEYTPRTLPKYQSVRVPEYAFRDIPQYEPSTMFECQTPTAPSYEPVRRFQYPSLSPFIAQRTSSPPVSVRRCHHGRRLKPRT